MATNTTNYGWTKPDYEDDADIKDLNDNFDGIDAQVKAIDDQVQLNKNNISLLQKVSVTQVFYVATLTWNQSADGIYYSDGVSIAGISTIDSLLITGFSNLRATDVITPIVTNDRTKVRFTSNVNSFANNDTSMTLCIIGSG